MTRITYAALSGLFLLAAGCRTCDDRPRAFGRLRDAFDRDDYARRPPPIAPVPRMSDPCAPCAAGPGVHSGQVLGGSTGGAFALPTGWSSGPTYTLPPGGTIGPFAPSGPGTTVLPPPGTYAPRDNELPPPGGYSQPGAVDMGNAAPKPANNLTGRD